MSSLAGSQKSDKTLLSDRKFLWLLVSTLSVGALEILSLTGTKLPSVVTIPFCTAFILFTGHEVLRKGFVSATKLNFASINLLMVVAVIGAYFLGEYEEAAVVVVLFSLGERLEEFGFQKSQSALKSLLDRSPKVALVKDQGERPVEQVKVDELIVIKPYEAIPLDGIVVGGFSSIDEASITGEPIPKDKHEGDLVFAGTMNKQGYLEVKVQKASSESTLVRIVQLTAQASKAKAEFHKFIEKFAKIYTPAVLAAAILLVAVPTLLGKGELRVWLEQALTLLVISCPCALVISTPVTIYAAIGRASSMGVLVKGGLYIEGLARAKVVAMDKTGTLTHGKPVVTDVLPFNGASREGLLACAAGLELFSEHPLGATIVDAAKAQNLTPHKVENFRIVPGKGITADCVVCHDREHSLGSLRFVTEQYQIQQDIANMVDTLHGQGKTSIVVGTQGGVEGIIAVSDAIKSEAKAAIAKFKGLGIRPVMLTGDHRTPASVVASELGISDVKAGLLPEEKAKVIADLVRTDGVVVMVGDGVNDAPALATASVGIAMGAAGSDAAIEAAGVAVLNDKLDVLPPLFDLGRQAMKTIRFNTILAVVTKATALALAVGGLSSLALAILADVGVTIVVILNSLRLMRFTPTQT